MAPPHGGEDWRKRLRNASFRGSHFWVETDGVSGGRRIVVHEFPLSELPYNEDMGQQARRYEVEAYVVGGQAGAQAKALVEACTAPGPASLVLPLFGTIAARCLDISTNRSKDRHGFVAFRLRFISDGLSLSSLGGTPHRKSRVRTAALEMPAAMRAAFKQSYRGVRVPEFVWRSAVSTTSLYLDNWMVQADSAGLRGDPLASFEALVADVDGALEALLRSGAVGNKFDQTAYWASGEIIDTDPFANQIDAIASAFREAAEPEAAVHALGEMLEFGEGLAAIPLTTLSRRREAENQESLLALFNRSALAHLAIAVTEATYTNRREAIAARAMVAQRFEEALRQIQSGREWEVSQALSELQGLTIEYLSSLIADLAPVMQIEAGALMPSIYWGYRLYKDAPRGDDLWARNRVKHPAWMPAIFEALVR